MNILVLTIVVIASSAIRHPFFPEIKHGLFTIASQANYVMQRLYFIKLNDLENCFNVAMSNCLSLVESGNMDPLIICTTREYVDLAIILCKIVKNSEATCNELLQKQATQALTALYRDSKSHDLTTEPVENFASNTAIESIWASTLELVNKIRGIGRNNSIRVKWLISNMLDRLSFDFRTAFRGIQSFYREKMECVSRTSQKLGIKLVNYDNYFVSNLLQLD